LGKRRSELISQAIQDPVLNLFEWNTKGKRFRARIDKGFSKMKKLLFICLFLLLTTSQSFAQNIDDHLIGHWPFNGNANDETANANHGAVNGATPVADRFGNESSAYSFDGNDNIIIPNSSSLDMTGPLSFSVWVKPETLSGTRMILGKSNYSSKTNYLIRVKPDGYIQWEYDGYTESDSNPLQLSTWHHVVVTATGPGLLKKVYVDKELIAMTPTSSGPSGIVTDAFTIGYASYNSEFFIGAIDEIRMYDKELSTADIEALFNDTDPVEELIFVDGFE
jgi:hypothetical protein